MRYTVLTQFSIKQIPPGEVTTFFYSIHRHNIINGQLEYLPVQFGNNWIRKISNCEQREHGPVGSVFHSVLVPFRFRKGWHIVWVYAGLCATKRVFPKQEKQETFFRTLST